MFLVISKYVVYISVIVFNFSFRATFCSFLFIFCKVRARERYYFSSAMSTQFFISLCFFSRSFKKVSKENRRDWFWMEKLLLLFCCYPLQMSLFVSSDTIYCILFFCYQPRFLYQFAGSRQVITSYKSYWISQHSLLCMHTLLVTNQIPVLQTEKSCHRNTFNSIKFFV